jgi:hypothetical protein
MDPEAAFEAMRAAYREKDWEETIEQATNLRQWLAMGGFAPAGYGRINAQTIINALSLDAMIQQRNQRMDRA